MSNLQSTVTSKINHYAQNADSSSFSAVSLRPHEKVFTFLYDAGPSSEFSSFPIFKFSTYETRTSTRKCMMAIDTECRSNHVVTHTSTMTRKLHVKTTQVQNDFKCQMFLPNEDLVRKPKVLWKVPCIVCPTNYITPLCNRRKMILSTKKGELKAFPRYATPSRSNEIAALFGLA